MSIRQQLRDTDIAEIMARFKKVRAKGHPIMEACRRVADQMETVTPETVWGIQRRFKPTTDIAADYLRAKSLAMTMKVVRKANVDQLIGILGRPNIGVLEATSEGGRGGSQFMIGVAVDSLGGVKVGVQVGPAPEPKQLEGANETAEFVDGDDVGGDDVPAVSADAVDDEEPKPRILKRREWHQDPPKPPPIQPVPVQEGRILGRSVHVRIAEAKAIEKATLRDKKKQQQRVKDRMRELAEGLK